MARFSFRLQQFLDVKEQLEEQKELVYAAAVRKREEERARLHALQDELQQQLQALRLAVQNMLEPIDIRRYNHSIERLKQHIKLQEERLQAATTYTEAKRLELVEAMKERKALEIVRDNAREAHRQEENIAEMQQVDELVSFKYGQTRASHV